MGKYKMYYIVLLSVFIVCETYSQNFNFNKDTVSLKLDSVEGYILKKDGFPFLIVNSLIDIENEKTIKEWNKINNNDKIGKYYKIDDSENYLICLPYSLDFFKPLFLIMEINPKGDLIKVEKYNFGNAHKWNTYYKDFWKLGDRFLILSQGGHGCGLYYYCKLSVFKDLLPQDSLKYFFIEESKIFHRNKKNEGIKRYSASWFIQKDEITFKYKTFKGKVKHKKDFAKFYYRKFGHKRLTVKYVFKNNEWKTNDTLQLKILDKFIKLNSHQIII